MATRDSKGPDLQRSLTLLWSGQTRGQRGPRPKLTVAQIAREAGLSRGSLYAALSEDGNPTLATLMRVMKSLGMRLGAEPLDRAA